MKYDLSILIPARCEMFLARTVEDILKNKRGKTEIIVGLDGKWADPPIVDHQDVTLVYYPISIGQRAMTNQLCKISTAKYVMKADAHCAFDEGFDIKMIAEMHDNWSMVPTMRNLHAFNWKCPDGHTRYQGPSGPCHVCKKETVRDVVWIPKTSPQSKSYCFDPEPHFQYFKEFNKRPEGTGSVTPSMSIQGSAFMCTREKYWELNLSDESFGSWGSQGIEVACKTWLSGGQVMINQKTWYAHMFRTQGGDFGFPYAQSGRQVEGAKKFARELFFGNKWPQQIHPLSWLVEKFWPVHGWKDEDLKKLKDGEAQVAFKAPVRSKTPTKGIIYYTDNQLNLKIAHAVQRQLKKVSAETNIPIVSASLKPMDNMGKNIHVKMEWGRLAMVTQILAALEASDADIIFFCEHDVLYPASHFDIIPEKKDTFYYDRNWWKVRTTDTFALHYEANQLSGMCAYRDILIPEYKERVRRMTVEGWNSSMGYEPGTRGKYRGGFSDSPWESWKAKDPHVDIKHGHNLTSQRWSQDKFRHKENCQGWLEGTSENLPYWGDITGLVDIKRQ